MATGVLIIGVGRGTKSLQSFLGCTKSYTTEVLFGAATDTYDILGKVLSTAPYAHITREKVEEVLAQFRGEGMQTPPIYSALSQDGKRLYEYAREGKEPPRAIEQRPVTVERLEMLEWLIEHEYRWPLEDAPKDEKTVANKILKLDEVKGDILDGCAEPSVGDNSSKRQNAEDKQDERVLEREQESQSTKDDDAAPKPFDTERSAPSTTQRTEPAPAVSADIPPAVKLDMTVTSGFYVRSLCHDLGKAVGSHGLMASLVRTRQGDYKLGENVLDHADLAKGEEVWGPKIRPVLEAWLEKNPASHDVGVEQQDRRRNDRSGGQQSRRGGRSNDWSQTGRRNSSSEPDAEGQRGDASSKQRNGYNSNGQQQKRRRNSSSEPDAKA